MSASSSLSSSNREVWIKNMYFTIATHSRWDDVVSAYHEKEEITSTKIVTFSFYILLEAEKHTNAFFLIVHLEFSLRWISIEFSLESPNLYLGLNSKKKETSPRWGRPESWSRCCFFSSGRSGVFIPWCQERREG